MNEMEAEMDRVLRETTAIPSTEPTSSSPITFADLEAVMAKLDAGPSPEVRRASAFVRLRETCATLRRFGRPDADLEAFLVRAQLEEQTFRRPELRTGERGYSRLLELGSGPPADAVAMFAGIPIYVVPELGRHAVLVDQAGEVTLLDFGET